MATTDHPPAGRQPAAIRSALTVLEQVARAGPGVTARELSAALGMSPATTYRLVNLLVAEEYLVRLPDLRGFALGRKVVELAGAVAHSAVPAGAADAVAELRSRVRLAVHLASLRHGRLRMLDPDPDHPPSPDAVLARHLHASALGKLLLADQPDWHALAPGAPAELRQLTPHTVGRPDALDRELDRVRGDRVARQFGELRTDRGCVAMPVRDPDGALVAGLAVSGSPDRIAALAPAVLRLVERCAHDLARLLHRTPA
ncbi:IclR family transcriptional regulator C-terminal domain-containing protein [Phytohabitans sp. ZYX-F-186]|uniref:IclR family transcriptional regulator C-terminal domain-containing protein n=1 Tax=Phytohabitans maris TaxID=3071409 RepID=A0ABU0ZBI1_9ACTN|nr:IclR family transcriptional regulator C-terminal domain-containing protein [Phytohabitans sp. ZYX-F-186]MDQ7904405.1 IclR family transcriptional regulator C-terminal domain-containing protein [Phytohabitans sp. ZYX-F-186]